MVHHGQGSVHFSHAWAFEASVLSAFHPVDCLETEKRSNLNAYLLVRGLGDNINQGFSSPPLLGAFEQARSISASLLLTDEHAGCAVQICQRWDEATPGRNNLVRPSR